MRAGRPPRRDWRRWLTAGPRRAHRVIAAAVALAAAAAIAATIGTRPPPSIGAELGWQQTGEVLLPAYLRALRGEYEDPVWHEALNNYGANNPHVGTYLVGAVGAISRALGNERWAFRLLALVGGATAGLMFLLAARSGGVGTGLAAAGLLLLHPVAAQLRLTLMPDPFLMLFVVGALWAMAHLDATRSPERHLGWAAATGVAVGLAISTRLYGFALAPVAAWALWRARVDRRERIAGLALAGLAAVTVFVVTNPLLWTDPAFGLWSMTAGRLPGDALQATPTAGERWQAWTYLASMSLLPWREAAFPGVRFPACRWIDAPWLAAGLMLLAAGVVATIRRREWMPAIWLGAACGWQALVLGAHRSGWWSLPELVLLPVLATVWMQGIGARQIASWIGGALSKRRR